MSKYKAILLAMLAVAAFSAVATASASAHQWLAGGNAITAAKSAVTTGKWLLLGLGIFGIKLHVVCDGKLTGTVGPGAEDEVTAATDLNGNKVINCEILSGEKALCEGTLALVEAQNLPWKTLLVLDSSGNTIDHFFGSVSGKEPAFGVKCLLGGGTWSEELCEGLVLSELLVNESGGLVGGKITNQLSSSCKNSSNVAHVYGEGKIELLSKEALSFN